MSAERRRVIELVARRDTQAFIRGGRGLGRDRVLKAGARDRPLTPGERCPALRYDTARMNRHDDILAASHAL
jgi:hypothetical protein